MSRPTANFRDLRASFESRSKSTSVAKDSSLAGDLANMSLPQPGKKVPSQARTIDSVLETTPAAPPVRPPLAKLRPSWIGPAPSERPATPGVQVMKQSVTVQYSSPGLQPPVFICTSLSDPQWDLLEMSCEARQDWRYLFSKVFQVEDGQYQYKFRLGVGDWWVCDESKPTVDDGPGNKNNLVDVKPQPILSRSQPSPAEEATHETQVTDRSTAPQAPTVLPLPQPSLPPMSVMTSDHSQPATTASPPKAAVTQPANGAGAEHQPETEEAESFESVDDEDTDDAHATNLLKHESFNESTLDDDGAGTGDDESSTDDADDESDGRVDTPLLRHETFSKPSGMEGFASASSPTKDVKPHDIVLVKCPADHAGIIDMIVHTQQRLREDEVSEDESNNSPVSQALSDSPALSCSLPRIYEAEEEVLRNIRNAEEAEFLNEVATGEELDPLAPSMLESIRMHETEPEDDDFDPKAIGGHDKAGAEEYDIIEVVEERKSFVDTLFHNLGGRGQAIAVAVGLLVVAAGICTMQYL